MTGRAFAALARKEARALLPIAAATVMALAAVAALGTRATPAGLLAFALGAAALGAWSIGHEYAERTLGPQLLAQPLGRPAIFAIKLMVLAAFLLVVAGFAETALPASRQPAGSAPELPWFVPAAALSALLLAPALTMLCRSAIGGAVFTLAVPLVLWLGSYLWPAGSTTTIGVVPDDVDGSGLPVLTPLFAFVWIAGGALGWSRFARLEALDGGWSPLAFVRRASNASPDRRGPLIALVVKELRLQTMAFVVTALFAVVWLALRYLKGDAVSGASPLLPTVVMHGFVTAVLVGSLASAEERQLGTIEWQLLQPVSRRTQWAVKVAVALATAVALAVGPPHILQSLWPPADRIGTLFWFAQPVVVVALTIVAAYVSSATRSALAALLLSLPALGALAVFVYFTAWLLSTLQVGALGLAVAIWLARHGWLSGGVFGLLGVVCVLGCVAVAAGPFVYFAGRNHAGGPTSARQYGVQAAWIGTGLAMAMLLVALAGPISSISWRTRLYGPAGLWNESPRAIRTGGGR